MKSKFESLMIAAFVVVVLVFILYCAADYIHDSTESALGVTNTEQAR